jgi:ABC-type cobalamin transport system ATPase subunit
MDSDGYPFDIVVIVWYWPIMNHRTNKTHFSDDQIREVNQAVALSEELVSNHYKMSPNEWLRPRYDVKTLVELHPNEIVDEPFAQVIRYQGKPIDATLESDAYDFYKICIQDHNILTAMAKNPQLSLLAFSVYIVAHELIHIVRFSKFLQSFDASSSERMAEESRVHILTHDILCQVRLPDMDQVLAFYKRWR